MSGTENINMAIMSHEQQTDDWEYNKSAQLMYDWFKKFNKEFFQDKLGIPVISFERTGYKRLGHFVIGRNLIGAKWNINLNRNYLGKPLWFKLKILLHEMCHQYEQEFGKPGKNNYHNKAFQTLTTSLGIPCNSRGVTSEITDPFVSFLKKNDVEVEAVKLTRECLGSSVVLKASNLKKWTCGCTNVRVAISDFQAVCLKCGNNFFRV